MLPPSCGVEAGPDLVADRAGVLAGEPAELRVGQVELQEGPLRRRCRRRPRRRPAIAAKAGRVLTSWDLAEEYALHDVDGSRPSWGRHFAEQVQPATT